MGKKLKRNLKKVAKFICLKRKCQNILMKRIFFLSSLFKKQILINRNQKRLWMERPNKKLRKNCKKAKNPPIQKTCWKHINFTKRVSTSIWKTVWKKVLLGVKKINQGKQLPKLRLNLHNPQPWYSVDKLTWSFLIQKSICVKGKMEATAQTSVKAEVKANKL